MKRSTIVVVGILLTMTMAWAAFGQAGGGAGKGKGRGGAGGGRGGFGAMGEVQQKAMADLQEQVAKLRALTEASTKAMAGGYQNMSEEDRAKMKERFTEQQKILAAIQGDVDRLRIRQLAAEYNQEITALKDAQAMAEKEKAKEAAQMIGNIIAERQRQMEEKVTAMGMTMDQLEKMGTRGGGRRQQ